MKPLLIRHVLAFVIVSGFLLFLHTGREEVWSLGLGWGLMLANMAIFSYVFRRIFRKKTIARTTAAIVLKYLIFGLIIYWAAKSSAISKTWFLVGVSTVVITALLSLYQGGRREDE